MISSITVAYFGKQTVERAVANYFVNKGVTENVREELMLMAINNQDDFFQMVCDFVEKEQEPA